MAPVGEVVIGLYQAPAPDWPVLVLVSTPLGGSELGLERGLYAWEALPDEAAALAHLERMAAMMRGHAQAVILRPPTLI